VSTDGRRIASIEYTGIGPWGFLTVTTEDGLVGTGQSGYFSYPDTAVPIVDALRDALLGEDANRIGRIAAKAHRTTPFRGGALMSTVAAIDLALWDLKGKRYEVPAYELMGGAHRYRVRLHVLLGMADWPATSTVESLAAEAAKWVTEGFTAVKFDPLLEGEGGYAHQSYSEMIGGVVNVVAVIRDTVGNDVDIALEIHRKLGVAEAKVLADELRPFRIFMYEDSIPPDSLDSLSEVANNVLLPVGAGERQDNIYEFRELLQRGGTEYVRPDVGTAGGLTNCTKIAAMAEAHHKRVIAHNFHSPYLTAATLQLYAAVPNVGTFEWSPQDEIEPGSLLLDSPIDRDGGFINISSAPGLGHGIATDAAECIGSFVRIRPGAVPEELDGSLRLR
jgi:galactonate dehydratase